MTEPTTEPGKWLVAEYARTPGDPKWYPGLGLESTVIAIEAEAFASLDARYAAQLNLTIKANSTIEDLREELHAAHEHRRVVEKYMAAPDPAPLDELTMKEKGWREAAFQVGYNRGADEARASLDVERLARAVSLVMSDLDWTPAPIGVVQNSYWQDRAEGIAREYAALAAIEGDKE